jgi:hypothetical protein
LSRFAARNGPNPPRDEKQVPGGQPCYDPAPSLGNHKMGETSPRLDGWKAVAEYLGRDVRTAQRWSRERGMPVHHVPGGKGGGVFAYPADLDAWLVQAKGATAPPHPTVPLDHVSTPDVTEVGSASKGWRRTRTAWVAVALTILVVTGLALRSAGFLRPRAAFARLELKGTTLVASDVEGKPLWSFGLSDRGGASLRDPGESTPLLVDTVHADLDGDGGAEVVALLQFVISGRANKQLNRGELLAFSPSGRLLWTYRPDVTFDFAGRKFAGPWRIIESRFSSDPLPRVWVSFIHHTWWPSFVMSVGASGHAEMILVNAGHVESLEMVRRGNNAYLLAGGVNNEFASAALAVIDPMRAPATSPQNAGSPFYCEQCPPGRPAKYLLFPRSELNIALGHPLNFADIIQSATGSTSVDVSVREAPDNSLRAIYTLAGDFTPVSVAMSDQYWTTHRELSQAGKLDHAPEQCPERTDGMVVRAWEPAAGWKEIRVRPTFAPSRATDRAPVPRDPTAARR